MDALHPPSTVLETSRCNVEADKRSPPEELGLPRTVMGAEGRDILILDVKLGLMIHATPCVVPRHALPLC